MLIPLHCLRVYCTACKVKGVKKILIVWNPFIVAHIEATVMAENTWPDILRSTFHKLCDPLLVCKEWAGKACSVYLSFLDGSGGSKWVHSSSAYYRNIDKLSDMLNVLKVTVLRHIDRRVSPIPCVICSVVAVEHIVSSVL